MICGMAVESSLAWVEVGAKRGGMTWEVEGTGTVLSTVLDECQFWAVNDLRNGSGMSFGMRAFQAVE